MKLRIEKPNEQVMRFFTPELYIRFNSPDDAVANQADEDWESALKAYSHHMSKLRRWMPHEVKKLAKLNLHDAEVVAFRTFGHAESPFPNHRVEVSLKLNNQLVELEYFLSDDLQIRDFGDASPFSKQCPLWLYEEIDVDADAQGMFVHRILLSDGRVITIPFTWVRIHRQPWSELYENHTAQQNV